MGLKTLFTGHNLLCFNELDSTNSALLNMLKSGHLSEGTVVYAKHQTLGRGQRGNTWLTEANKNITASVFYCPLFLTSSTVFMLNKISSLAICDTIKHLLPDVDVKIKWPNDVLIGTKKVAGILIENTLKGIQLNDAVIGIGLNLNQEKFSKKLNASSLKQLSGIDYEIEPVLYVLLENIEARYLQLRAGLSKKIDTDYLDMLYNLNKNQRFKNDDLIFDAIIFGVDGNGKLLLKMDDGSIVGYNFKEIQFVL